MKQSWIFQSSIIFAVVLSLLTGCQSTALNDTANAADIVFAENLWRAMEKQNLVGSQSIPLEPFFGGAKPHGMILEIYNNMLSVGDHSGFLVLKRNYNGKGVSIATVRQNRKKHLTSITVMYQREPGYDEDNLNLFWAKYKPDGSLFSKSMQGQTLQLAGRLIKGKTSEDNKGCLYCHSSAGGGDYIFYPNIRLPGFHYMDE